MKFDTRFETLKLADIVAPPYNPRADIERGSPDYNKLMQSIKQHGMVEPPVVNICNMRCIGGNQRLVVLRDLGWTDVLCSVIDQPDEMKEKKLCLALNKIDGRWDAEKLGVLLRDDEVFSFETGFDVAEAELYRHLEDAHEPDISDYSDDSGENYQLDADDGTEDIAESNDEALDDDGTKTTITRIGVYTCQVSVARYNRLIESIRDKGKFTDGEVVSEIKRRLMGYD